MGPKRTLLLLLCCSLLQYCFAQTGNVYKNYFDYYEKPVTEASAIYYTKVFKKNPADQYWTRNMYAKADEVLKSSGYSLDSMGLVKQGAYIIYYNSGIKYQEGHYENGKKEGAWTSWYTAGNVLAKYNYRQGKIAGKNMSWYENGNTQDSFLLDSKGNGRGYGFYTTGEKRYEGDFTAGDKTGTWYYYYNQPGSHKSMEVQFTADSLVSKTCYTVDGNVQASCYYEKEAAFKAGDAAWPRYLGEAMSDSKYTKFMKRGAKYSVIVKFVVTKEGKIVDVQVEKPGIKKIDDIAERIIRNSPPWEPAIQYNQQVNAYRRQPMTFVVEE